MVFLEIPNVPLGTVFIEIVTYVKYNVKSHHICPLQADLVLKFRDVASQVVFCFAISLTPLHKVLPDGLCVGDTNWLFAMSLVVPSLCPVVATHNAVPNLCE